MAIPTQTDAFRITLDLLSDGKVYSRQDAFQKAKIELKITDAEGEERLGSGTPTYISRVDWAIVYLFRGGLLDRVSRGVYQINERGLEIAKTDMRGSDFSRWLDREIAEKNPWKTASDPSNGSKTSEDEITYDAEAFERIIKDYEAHLEEVRKDERYKWEAMYCFQQNWNPGADNYGEMITNCVAKTDNLLTNNMWFAAGMLKLFAWDYPDDLRSMMNGLFDEQQPLKDRLREFEKRANDLLARENAKREKTGERKALGHFQDPRSMSLYLGFIYPQSHYLYKPSIYKSLAKKLGIATPGNKFDKVIEHRALCDELLSYLEKNHADLIERSDSLLPTEWAAADPTHHLLIADIEYYSDSHMGEIIEINQRTWMYAPGEGACAWDDCVEQGIMVLGWDELGDHSKYPTRESMADALKEAYQDDGTKKMASLACWQFQNELQPGDIVYAKRGLYTVIGKGIVKSEARYDPGRKNYTHVRDVEWVLTGEWDIRDAGIPMDSGNTMKTLPLKTLTEWTMYPDAIECMESLISGKPSKGRTASDCKYWWLNANPGYWSFDSIQPGEGVVYEAYNEKGNKRTIFRHYKEARVGDKVIGYHTHPKKEVVCLCEVASELDETAPDPQDRGILVVKTQDVARKVPYEEIKNDPILSDSEYVKSAHNGTIFELTEQEYQRIVELSEEADDDLGARPANIEPYTDKDFLEDVFMSSNDLADLKDLLKGKKNVILQGAPGTGKTYAAKRLAWTMMGEEDRARVQLVQFHQSTSYEDFVFGYRPNDAGGFVPMPGVFTEFCWKAAAQPDKDFFFIIDEINRANISKVFGELLMLIEADHRDESLSVAASERPLTVPSNVFIIGMMNTADRGLALIDYALRRRFAFFEMKPALDHERFRAKAGKDMEELVDAVRKLNEKIEDDPSLGSGFRIGHSYFCPRKDGTLPNPEAVVKYELAPLLEEYWFDNKKRAQKEVEKLREAAKS